MLWEGMPDWRPRALGAGRQTRVQGRSIGGERHAHLFPGNPTHSKETVSAQTVLHLCLTVNLRHITSFDPESLNWGRLASPESAPATTSHFGSRNPVFILQINAEMPLCPERPDDGSGSRRATGNRLGGECETVVSGGGKAPQRASWPAPAEAPGATDGARACQNTLA